MEHQKKLLTHVIAEGAAVGNGRVEAGYLEVGIGGRGPVALHGNQPWRRNLVRVGTHRHAQRRPQVVRQVARLLLLQPEKTHRVEVIVQSIM